MADTLDLLRRVPTFEDLPDDQLTWFLGQSKELRLTAGVPAARLAAATVSKLPVASKATDSGAKGASADRARLTAPFQRRGDRWSQPQGGVAPLEAWILLAKRAAPKRLRRTGSPKEMRSFGNARSGQGGKMVLKMRLKGVARSGATILEATFSSRFCYVWEKQRHEQ